MKAALVLPGRSCPVGRAATAPLKCSLYPLDMWGHQLSIRKVFTHPTSYQPRHLLRSVQWAAIVPALELCRVPPQMFDADVMVNPVKTPFEQGPMALYPVGRSLLPDVLARRMLDRLMRPGQPLICSGFVGVDCRSFNCVAHHKVLERLFVHPLHDLGVDPACRPVSNSRDRCLADGSPPGVQFPVSVLVGLLTANISLIDFD